MLVEVVLATSELLLAAVEPARATPNANMHSTGAKIRNFLMIVSLQTTLTRQRFQTPTYQNLYDGTLLEARGFRIHNQ